MENLLKVKPIITQIAQNLNVSDFLNLKQVNRDTYEQYLNSEFEQEYYAKRLILLDIHEVRNKPVQKEELISAEKNDDLTPVNIFDKIKDFDRQDAAKVYKSYYKIFNPYCQRLSNNRLVNFFPQIYASDPLTQGKILQNIKRYNNSNIFDLDYYNKVLIHFNILKELFTTSCLNEMEINFKNQKYEVVAKFTNVLFESGEKNIAIDFFNSRIEYPVIKFEDDIAIDDNLLDTLFDPLKQFLNDKIKVIDIIFVDNYPMVMSFYENFVQETLLNLINNLLKDSTEESYNDEVFLSSFSLIYFKILEKFCYELDDSKNGLIDIPKDKTFKESIKDLLNVYLEPNILTFLNLSTTQFEVALNKQFQNFKTEQENKRETDLLNSSTIKLPTSNKLEDENKNNFLDSFTKVFRLNNKSLSKSDRDEQLNNNLNNLLNNNLQNIKSLLDLQLCYNVLQQSRDKIDTFLKFGGNENLGAVVNSKCEDIFKLLIKSMGEKHVKPAFEKAIDLLENYKIDDEYLQADIDVNSTSVNRKQSLEPLINFAELINTGDIILQMISIFYKNELVNRKIIDTQESSRKNIWQNEVLQCKKNFETSLDNYVADGLNIGINKLVDQITLAFNGTQLPTDYYPPPDELLREIRPSRCAIKVVSILTNHCFLLTGATDKGTIEVYQQEIGKRFFQILVEHIKKQIISTAGAIQLICDMNYYYEFIANRLKQKSIVPYFQGLKNVSSLYLIDGKDSKELGKLISDLGKFQGIFTQEEIYEFVQRRQDWVSVKRDVEKVMYGLGLNDCVIV